MVMNISSSLQFIAHTVNQSISTSIIPSVHGTYCPSVIHHLHVNIPLIVIAGYHHTHTVIASACRCSWTTTTPHCPYIIIHRSIIITPIHHSWGRLGGLVVKASASRAEDPGFESRLRRDFSGSTHTSDLQIATPAAILPGA